MIQKGDHANGLFTSRTVPVTVIAFNASVIYIQKVRNVNAKGMKMIKLSTHAISKQDFKNSSCSLLFTIVLDYLPARAIFLNSRAIIIISY